MKFIAANPDRVIVFRETGTDLSVVFSGDHIATLVDGSRCEYIVWTGEVGEKAQDVADRLGKKLSEEQGERVYVIFDVVRKVDL